MTLDIARINQYRLFSQIQAGRHRANAESRAAVVCEQASLVDSQVSTVSEQVSLVDRQEIDRAFGLIASALRTVETEVTRIAHSLEKLSPAQPSIVARHFEQLKQNKQKAQDIHYRYTEVCLASSAQHFTAGISPKERQLADRLMKLREYIAQLMDVCRDLLKNYKLLGEIDLPKDYGKSLSSIKMLGGILSQVFGGSFKYQANSFKIDAEHPVYIEQTGKIYVAQAEQLAGKLEELADALAAKYSEAESLATNKGFANFSTMRSFTN